MTSWRLIWVMILKELRTTFRERTQIRALAVSVAFMVVALGGSLSQSHWRNDPHAAVQAAVMTDREQRMVCWAVIGIATAASFFFAVGYLISAVLASFVGEKEARTLEVLLASPVSDRRLFLVKCTSALLPSACIGYGMTLLGAAVVWFLLPGALEGAPVRVIVGGLLLALPVSVIPHLWVLAVGVAISVKSETMKGASQILGVGIMILVFGCTFGIQALLRQFPGLAGKLREIGQSWLDLPFVAEYGIAMAVLAASAGIVILVGQVFFRRDRMLT